MDGPSVSHKLSSLFRDKSGCIDLAEFVSLMSSNLDVTKVILQQSNANARSDDLVTAQSMINTINKDELMDAFANFDSEHRGRLSKEEIILVHRAVKKWKTKLCASNGFLFDFLMV